MSDTTSFKLVNLADIKFKGNGRKGFGPLDDAWALLLKTTKGQGIYFPLDHEASKARLCTSMHYRAKRDKVRIRAGITADRKGYVVFLAEPLPTPKPRERR